MGVEVGITDKTNYKGYCDHGFGAFSCLICFPKFVPSNDSGLLNPDMSSQELRLQMGELTAQEERTARAAIRWANTRQVKSVSIFRCAMALQGNQRIKLGSDLQVIARAVLDAAIEQGAPFQYDQ